MLIDRLRTIREDDLMLHNLRDLKFFRLVCSKLFINIHLFATRLRILCIVVYPLSNDSNRLRQLLHLASQPLMLAYI